MRAGLGCLVFVLHCWFLLLRFSCVKVFNIILTVLFLIINYLNASLSFFLLPPPIHPLLLFPGDEEWDA